MSGFRFVWVLLPAIPDGRIPVNLSKKSPQRRKDAEVLESFRLKFLLIFTKINTVFFAPDGRD